LKAAIHPNSSRHQPSKWDQILFSSLCGCTGARRNPATCSANQGFGNDDANALCDRVGGCILQLVVCTKTAESRPCKPEPSISIPLQPRQPSETPELEPQTPNAPGSKPLTEHASASAASLERGRHFYTRKLCTNQSHSMF
jgi:hypothetical protein